MFARALLLFLGSLTATSAFIAPVGNGPAALARSQLRISAVAARRPVSALRMQQSPIKLTPQLFTELDTDGSGTISAAEVFGYLFLFRQSWI